MDFETRNLFFFLQLSLASQVAIPVASVRLVKKHKTAGLVPNGLAITTDSSQKVRFYRVPGHRPADWNTKLSQHMLRRCCKTVEMQIDATLRRIYVFSQHISQLSAFIPFCLDDSCQWRKTGLERKTLFSSLAIGQSKELICYQILRSLWIIIWRLRFQSSGNLMEIKFWVSDVSSKSSWWWIEMNWNDSGWQLR